MFWEDAFQHKPRMENLDREEIQQEMIGQEKTKIINTGSKGMAVPDGGSGTILIHKIEP
jgi:hypothetical protein